MRGGNWKTFGCTEFRSNAAFLAYFSSAQKQIKNEQVQLEAPRIWLLKLKIIFLRLRKTPGALKIIKLCSQILNFSLTRTFRATKRSKMDHQSFNPYEIDASRPNSYDARVLMCQKLLNSGLTAFQIQEVRVLHLFWALNFSSKTCFCKQVFSIPATYANPRPPLKTTASYN